MNENKGLPAYTIIIFGVLVLFLLSLVGCNKDYIVQNCSVNKNEDGTLVTCPDGSQVLIENQEAIVINLPNNKCKKGKK